MNFLYKKKFFSGLKNLSNLYIPICDYWMIFDNSNSPSQLISEGYNDRDIEIKNYRTFDIIKKIAQYDQEK